MFVSSIVILAAAQRGTVPDDFRLSFCSFTLETLLPVTRANISRSQIRVNKLELRYVEGVVLRWCKYEQRSELVDGRVRLMFEIKGQKCFVDAEGRIDFGGRGGTIPAANLSHLDRYVSRLAGHSAGVRPSNPFFKNQ